MRGSDKPTLLFPSGKFSGETSTPATRLIADLADIIQRHINIARQDVKQVSENEWAFEFYLGSRWGHDLMASGFVKSVAANRTVVSGKIFEPAYAKFQQVLLIIIILMFTPLALLLYVAAPDALNETADMFGPNIYYLCGGFWIFTILSIPQWTARRRTIYTLMHRLQDYCEKDDLNA